MNIRPCTPNDAAVICDIYNYYIKNTVITFEEELLTSDIILQRIESYGAKYPWLVLENASGDVVGYAYGAPWTERSAYQHTVEVTVYLHYLEGGKGYGSALYRQVLALLAEREFHAVVARIALPNEASVKFHEALGFKKVAHFTEVGRKFDRWIDVGCWQAMLKPAYQ